MYLMASTGLRKLSCSCLLEFSISCCRTHTEQDGSKYIAYPCELGLTFTTTGDLFSPETSFLASAKNTLANIIITENMIESSGKQTVIITYQAKVSLPDLFLELDLAARERHLNMS